ncbi:flagellar hook-length control protein FliK [Brumicola pallidula]|uniref:Flagellar hook-length control protein-like C-terminal domain-containing protein n=1 Tax=Brumicola pallidula DSM 14239 = ACAM 615 TaxID=1121922 RepID=K6ZLU3_9ALTE|nr:flagellar hook-length control protein FliK [Glaciecola pallidula]GAC29838.1 hypothetical protein GPAL_2987 [Glaciecola pallidula DSM 14239 = ACAM 615]
MPDITTVTLNQINALTRGSEASAARNNIDANNAQILNSVAAKVVVSQVSSNTITLTNPQNKQSVQIPASVLANLGNLKAGQSLELISIANKPNTYALIPVAVASKQNTNRSQQSAVLASSNISVNDNQLNTLIGKASAGADVIFNGKPVINISGRITAISANQVSLIISVPGSTLPAQQAQLSLNKAQVNNLQIGGSINIAVDISAKQARIISLSSTGEQNVLNANNPSTALKLSSQLTQLNSTVLSNKLISTSILQQLSTSSAASNAPVNNRQSNVVSGLTQAIIPLTDTKLADLPKPLLTSLQNAITKVNTTGASQVSLVVEGTGNPNTLKLSVLGNLNNSSVELNANQARSLLTTLDAKAPSNAGLGVGSGVGSGVDSSPSKASAANLATGSLASALSSTIAKRGFIGSRAELGVNQAGNPALTNPQQGLTDPATATATPTTKSPATSAPSFKTDALLAQLTKFIDSRPQVSQPSNKQNPTLLTQILSQLPNTKIGSVSEQLSNIGATQKTNPTSTIDALKTQVQTLAKTTLAQSASQTQTLANIISALNAEADIAELSPATQTLLRNIREQLPSTSTAQPAIDAKTIQQLISAPLNNPPLNALSPIAASSFLSGLVTLLQVSLASKLQRQSNKQASKLQDQIPEIIQSVVPNVKNIQSAKLLQDFRQFDAKHTLTAEVAKMLFSHQHHKLKSIDSSLHGQDQLYYALPNIFNKNADDIELLIKRETREDTNKNNSEGISSWYLTMKLDVGPLGQLLAKTQLSDDEIKLQLYTSTTELKNKALDMLPYLQRRLSVFGIELTEQSCQLGKIPKQLKSEHYQIFETQV